MPSYKLTYFNSKGRVEPCRYLFALAGQEYEDVRLTGEEWQKVKPSAPFGQLPLLEIDGQVFAQSNSITRLLARQFGLYGKDILEQAQGDMLVESISDIGGGAAAIMFTNDEKEKADKLQKYNDEFLPAMLARLENLGGDNGWFLGESITWVDVQFFHHTSFFNLVGIDPNWSKYPKLKNIIDNVGKNAKIAEWIKNRPKTHH